jgi:bacteriorhodopsin
MCFSALWLVQTLVWLVVVCGAVAILMILLPIVLGWLGWAGDVAMQIIRIVVAVVVIVAVIWFVYDLITCVGGIGPRRAGLDAPTAFVQVIAK